MLIRVLVSGIAAAVTFFLGGWVIYGLLLRSYFDSTMSATAKSVMNAEPNFVPLIVAQLAFGLLYAYILVKWASMRTLVGGAIGGATIGLLAAIGFDMQMTAFFKDMHVGSPYAPLLVDIIGATVLGALGGAVIGLVNGMMDKQSA